MINKSLISKSEEIDTIDEIAFLNKLLSSGFRNKKVVSIFLLSSIILSSIHAFSLKKIWEGRFQIVVANINRPSLIGSLSGKLDIKNLVTNQIGNENLKTEVAKLSSPSVLMPIFEFIKKKKEEKGENTSGLTYARWFSDSLKVELAKGTSVLEVFYRDTDKDLIIPVAQKISKEYQSYSGKNKRLNDKNMINYLDNQIEVYKDKNLLSLSKAQKFAEKHDLAIVIQQDIIPSQKDIPRIKIGTSNLIIGVL